MKRITAIILTVLFICTLPLAAGGQQDSESDGDGTFTIGWSNAGMGDSWRQFLQSNFLAEVAATPEITKHYITNADERPEKQIADIDDLIAKGIDGLIVYPTVGEAIAPAIERAFDAGIPVVVFGGNIATDKYTSLVTQDLFGYGRSQAEWLVKQLDGKGKIIMLSGIAGNTTAEERLTGAKEVFESTPGIEILDHQYCDWSITKTKSIMEAVINAFPEIDGIWADSGLMSWPALESLSEAGRPLVPNTGDQLNGYAKYLVANNVPGYVFPMTTRLSAESVKVLVQAMKGESVDKVHYIEVSGMGPDLIKNFVRPELSDWWWIGDDQIPAEFLPEL
ncbi:MAG: ABC transporter substrate-binding protein [Spirochaetales bacterium]|nr:ABC transporter substrate-binding protein [Spirochaetales bacterium]